MRQGFRSESVRIPPPLLAATSVTFAKAAPRSVLEQHLSEALQTRTKVLLAKAYATMGSKEKPWPMPYGIVASMARVVGADLDASLNAVVATGHVRKKDNGELPSAAPWVALRRGFSDVAATMDVEPTASEVQEGATRFADLVIETYTDEAQERTRVRVPWGPRVTLPDGQRGPPAISIIAGSFLRALLDAPEDWRFGAGYALLHDVESALGYTWLPRAEANKRRR